MDSAERARFSELYAMFHGRVWAYAARRVGAPAADDVAAETFLIAWRRFSDLPADPLPWLYGVARNIVLRQRASQTREDGTRAALALERPLAPPAESDPRLVEAWRRLSDSDRELLALIAWEELKVKEAAGVLGIAPAVFSVRLHRARKRLERHLAGSTAPATPSTRSETA